jgi:hypothetical protein
LNKIQVIIGTLLIFLLSSCTQSPNENNISNNNNTATASEQTDDKLDEQAFIDQFMGVWRNVDDNQYIMELKDNVETIGINESELLSRAEFTIIEINLDEQFIVLSGKKTESIGDHTEEFINKLELMDNGNKLQYSYNYESTNKQSLWIK